MIAVKPIIPKAFQSSIYRDEVKRAALDIQREVVADFKKTTATWDDKPTFGYKVDTLGGEVRIQVATDDPVYAYVDLGTKKHRIKPKHAGGRLAFQSRYKAKTKPNVIGSSSGGASGDTVFSKGVMHPGTKPRNFSKMIMKKWTPEFKKRMEQALDRFVERTGYKI